MQVKLLLPIVKEALEGRGIKEEAIENMSAEEVFNEFCNWEGFINWGPALWGVVENIKAAAYCSDQGAAMCSFKDSSDKTIREIMRWSVMECRDADLTEEIQQLGSRLTLLVSRKSTDGQ